ncbi:hypothetical protein [Kitasatospora sp. NPDC127116]|uniref:hypothetical protein n=1 Tax=Kitasatospora sp. NPDC127116 TaxID=3345367 RepID=UPI0036261F61
MSALVARPTENLAIGRVGNRPTAGSEPNILLRLSNWALRRGDREGARLFALRFLRAVNSDRVGEAL